MSDVLEELTGDELARVQVERRIRDWAHRIDELYERIGSWLPSGWSVDPNQRFTRMHEEPMREVGLPSRDLPILDLCKDGTRAVTVEPRGLWIIGANGRLDLRHGTAHYLIVDVAGNFEQPRWSLASLSDRHRQRPFDRAALRSIL